MSDLGPRRDFWGVLGGAVGATDESLPESNLLSKEWGQLDFSSFDELLRQVDEWAGSALPPDWIGEHEAILEAVQRTTGSEESDYCCFGTVHHASVRLVGNMMQISTKLDFTKPTHEFDVSMDSDYVMLKFPDETVFAQVSDLLTKALDAMHMLSTHQPVEVRAYVRTNAINDVLQRAKKPAEAVLKANLNIYGSRRDADKVGSILSSNKVYLQDPEDGIIGIEYHNPHVLEFPELEEPTRNAIYAPEAAPETDQPHAIEEAERVRRTVSAALGSLTRHRALGRTDGGPRVLTPLLRHQETALHFMLQRENGPIPPEYRLWEQTKPEEGGTSEIYRHKLTGAQELKPPSELGGGILADDMGMGKSMTSLALIANTLPKAQAWAEPETGRDDDSVRLKRARRMRRSKATLVIAPSTHIIQDSWKQDIDKRLDKTIKVSEYYGKTRDQEQELESYISSDIVFTTYHTVAASVKNPNNVMRQISWFRIILDEAHTIRRKETTLFKAVSELSAKFRWCLTGTPIQNRLEDLGSLISFLRISQLENASVFKKYVAGPIKEDPDKGAKTLGHLMDCICLRRTRELADMPAPQENIRWVALSPDERRHYANTLDTMAGLVRAKAWERTGKGNHFGHFQVQLQLRLLCNHGTFQKPFSKHTRRDRRTERDAMLDSMGAGADIVCSECGGPVSLFDAFGATGSGWSRDGTLCPHRFCPECISRRGPLSTDPSHPTAACSVCKTHEPAGYNTITAGTDAAGEVSPWTIDSSGSYFNKVGFSSKIKTLVEDLQNTEANEKCIVFSCWTRSLDLVSTQLRLLHIPHERIDGDHSLWQRQRNMENFTTQGYIRVLLMSTGVGAFGLNLTAANRIFILEPQWNPSVEKQAIGRAVRLGQKKPVIVTRYLTLGSVETTMHSQQIRKVELAKAGFGS